MIETKKKITNKRERAILIGVITTFQTEEKVQEYLDELAFLADTAGADSLKRFTQKLDSPNPKTFLGTGKIHALEAVNLLRGKNLNLLPEIAQAIEARNQERKNLDRLITREALEQIETTDLARASSTVVYQENWHKGVIGIVASRLIEKYYRPTVVLTKSGDKLAGSARSVEGFNLYEALEECEDHLIQFGGHPAAAGMKPRS